MWEQGKEGATGWFKDLKGLYKKEGLNRREGNELGHNSLRHEIWGSKRVDFLEVHYSLTNTEINVSALQPWAGATPSAEQVCLRDSIG